MKLVLVAFLCVAFGSFGEDRGLPGPASAADPDWPFPLEQRSRLVFVHPLVNYAINPVWQREWESSLACANGVQITSGSVSTEDLYTDLVVNITEPLGGRFRFIYRTVWLEGWHLDQEVQQHWLGFEGRFVGRFSAYLQTHPASDKEDLDLKAGLLWTDASRRKYLRLGVLWDDFMYGRKNDVGGQSEQESVSATWELRGQTGRWEIFSTGRYGSEYRRTYPDSELSPVVSAASGRSEGGELRLRHVWADTKFVAAELSHYRFQAAEQVRSDAESYDYRNEFVHLKALGVVPLGDTWGLRPEINWLRQWSAASGRREFAHEREDFFPALFVELRAAGKSIWELGYMAVHYQWAGVDGFTDKVKLGWTYALLPTARFQVSLSHEVDLNRFGGFNIQYQMNF